jgi:Big-like domain-containing protein
MTTFRWDCRGGGAPWCSLSRDLEQVDVTGLMGRALRLEFVAGLGLALALPALAAASSRGVATETMLTAETHDLNGRTQATITVSVTGQNGLPAHGAVTIADQGTQLAGVALDSEGHATTILSLPPGQHSLTASYIGDTTHFTSVSQVTPVRATTGTTPDFSIGVSPANLSLKQGQSGSLTASLTPVNASSLTAPMFVTLSCSGLPDQSSCTFSPENIEILPNATAPVTSSMVLATAASNSTARITSPLKETTHPVAWAILLPGTLGLAGLAFGARRRRWLSRIFLMAGVGLIAVLGTTACNPLYYYKNHGPSPNLPTPAGTYTLLVTAQSSNGITATTHSTTIVLTVQ